jgi:membrane-associated phospholipid phosphatase
MYYSLWGDATHLLVGTDRDALLIAWDQKLFGVQASVALQPFISPPLTGWMSFAYFFHLLNIPIIACFIYLRRPRRYFREMMCGVLVICFLGILGYLAVPAIGPLYTLRDQYTVPLSEPLAIFNRQVDFMDFARIRRDVFPSLHVGISFLVWLYAYRSSRRLFWILSPLILSLWISTVYLRYHYLVDVLAGLALAPLSFWLTRWLFESWGEITLSVPFPAAWIERWPQLGAPKAAPETPSRAVEQP